MKTYIFSNKDRKFYTVLYKHTKLFEEENDMWRGWLLTAIVTFHRCKLLSKEFKIYLN